MELKHIISAHISEKVHQHRSFEIIFTVNGTGKAFVGEYVYAFEPNELVIIGPNTYHCRIQNVESQSYEAYHLYFDEELFQAGIFEIQEAKLFLDFIQGLKESRRYSSSFSAEINALFKKCYSSQGLEKVILFLQILKKLEASFEYTSLLQYKYSTFRPNKQEKQLNVIYNYVHLNLKNDCSVKKTAQHFRLSSSTFCQFFKRQTGVSFSDYVNEKRIDSFCIQMIKTDLSIADIAHECGFQNISFFNRMFKKKKKMSPNEYRKIHLKQ